MAADTGTVTFDEQCSGNPKLNHLLCKTIIWHSDTDGNCIKANIGRLQGTIERINFRPSLTSGGQPSDNYDVTLTDVFGFDVLGGAGINLSNSVSRHFHVPNRHFDFYHWNPSDGDVLIRTGKGILHTICVTNPATVAGTFTVFDSLTGSSGDTVLTEVYICNDTAYFVPSTCNLDIEFTTGLFLNADYTIDGGHMVITYGHDILGQWIGPMDLSVSDAGETSTGYIDIFFRK